MKKVISIVLLILVSCGKNVTTSANNGVIGKEDLSKETKNCSLSEIISSKQKFEKLYKQKPVLAFAISLDLGGKCNIEVEMLEEQIIDHKGKRHDGYIAKD